MRGRLLGVLTACAAVVLGACDSARAGTCPGEPVATFRFASSGGPGGTCPFAPSGDVSFTATLSFDAGSTVYLCPDRAGAQPLEGRRDGDHIELAQQPAATSVAGCPCDLTVEESLEGVLDLPEGGVTSFHGVLRDVVNPSGEDATSCEPATGSGDTCGVPCEIVWQVTAVP